TDNQTQSPQRTFTTLISKGSIHPTYCSTTCLAVVAQTSSSTAATFVPAAASLVRLVTSMRVAATRELAVVALHPLYLPRPPTIACARLPAKRARAQTAAVKPVLPPAEAAAHNRFYRPTI
ncbi:hypothetical protein PSHT_15255, partial [Puccinia striiformis]